MFRFHQLVHLSSFSAAQYFAPMSDPDNTDSQSETSSGEESAISGEEFHQKSAHATILANVQKMIVARTGSEGTVKRYNSMPDKMDFLITDSFDVDYKTFAANRPVTVRSVDALTRHATPSGTVLVVPVPVRKGVYGQLLKSGVEIYDQGLFLRDHTATFERCSTMQGGFLPKIRGDDPVTQWHRRLSGRLITDGDVVKIRRSDPGTGSSTTYRVIDDACLI